MKPKIAVLTESPDDHYSTQHTLVNIIEPLENDFTVTRLSVLEGSPRNGKSISKTELKDALTMVDRVKKFDFVILVGNGPLQLLTGHAGISRARGKPFMLGKTHCLPMNNPSVIKHDPNQQGVMEADLQLFRDIVEFGGVPQEEKLSIRLVLTRRDFLEMKSDLHGTVSFDIETNSLNAFQTHTIKRVKGQDTQLPEPAKIISLGFGTKRNQWILPAAHWQSPWAPESIQSMVDELTEDVIDDLNLVTQNGKFDMLWMYQHFGVQWQMSYDTMIAHFLLNENSRHGLKYLAQVYLGAPDWEVDLDTKQGKTELTKHATYLAHDLYYTRELRFAFGRLMQREPGVEQVFKHILMPCANLFVEIEYDGVFIDVDKFEDAEIFLREQYNSALKALAKWEPKNNVNAKGKPEPFNWGSTQQLGQLLYRTLKLPVIEKTPTGNPSCSESVIKRLNHPCTEALLKFREAKQQLSFFIDGWKPYLHKRFDGYYLHPSFKLHGTVTGRLSCENPNLQQVPRDKRIRSLISAPAGWTLIECDLSQIELRIAAELANERAMIYAFLNGIDIHWLTAISEISRGGGLTDLVLDTARTWKQDKKLTYAQSIEVLLEMGPDQAVEINSAWKEYRKKAKAVNFGYLYGMWWKKFKDYARDSYGVIITDGEAEASRNAFFDNYPDLPEWHNRQKRFVRRHGYVATLSGRKRRLEAALAQENTPERKAAERQAINSPVQSFANDWNLMSALQLRSEFGRDKVRICGTVHDAVLFRVRNEHVKKVFLRMLEIMKAPKLLKTLNIEMSVPIEADGSIGPWGAGVSLDKWEKANAG